MSIVRKILIEGTSVVRGDVEKTLTEYVEEAREWYRKYLLKKRYMVHSTNVENLRSIEAKGLTGQRSAAAHPSNAHLKRTYFNLGKTPAARGKDMIQVYTETKCFIDNIFVDDELGYDDWFEQRIRERFPNETCTEEDMQILFAYDNEIMTWVYVDVPIPADKLIIRQSI